MGRLVVGYWVGGSPSVVPRKGRQFQVAPLLVPSNDLVFVVFCSQRGLPGNRAQCPDRQMGGICAPA